MRRSFLTVPLVIAALLITPTALGTGGVSAGTPAPVEYNDPTGDAGTGADIAKTAVSNDDAGNITFRIEIPNRPTVTGTLFVQIDIDADRNAATGATEFEGGQGTDYSIGFVGGVTTVLPWTGSGFGAPSFPASLTGSYSAGVLTVTINAADLGGTQGFTFWVGVADNFSDPLFADVAPELFVYSYNLVFQPNLAGIVPPAGLLKTVKPGKTLAVKGFKAKLDDGSVAAPDSITCVLKIAGKVLAPTGKCKWKIPITAAGKRLTLIVTLTFDDDKLTKTYSGKVAKK